MITRETIDKTLALPKMISPARAAITVAQEMQSEKQSGRSVELQDQNDDQSMTKVTILDAAIRRKARGRSTVEHLDEETIFRSSSCLLYTLRELCVCYFASAFLTLCLVDTQLLRFIMSVE